MSLDLTGPEDSTRLQRLEDHETIRKGSLDALYFFKNLNPLYYNLAQGSKGSIPRGRRCYKTAFEDVLEKGVGCCHAILWVENLKLLGLRDKKNFTLPTGSKNWERTEHT